MSQSPDEAVNDSRADAYNQGWSRLLVLLSRGGSLSGRERNCCFLNTGNGTGKFADVSGVSGLNFLDDARALAWDDWDQDGDLDVWMVNRTGPQLRFARNNTRSSESTASSHYLSIKLRGTRCNRDAIGAKVSVTLEGESPVTISRTTKAGESYLSQSSKWLHFGLGEHERIAKVEVRWPEGPGGAGELQVFNNLSVDKRYVLVEGDDTAQQQAKLTNSTRIDPNPTLVQPEVAEDSPKRVVVLGRIPMPRVEYHDFEGELQPANSPSDKPKVLNLWASWCAPCLAELTEWSKFRDELAAAGADIVLLSVDRLGDQRANPEAAEQTHKRLELPFVAGYLTSESAEAIDACLGAVQRDYRRPLGVPMTLLLDQHGQVAAIYRGRVSAETLVSDIQQLQRTPEQVRNSVSPIPGTWLHNVVRPDPLYFAAALRGAGNVRAAEDYLRHVLDLYDPDEKEPYAISQRSAGLSAFALGSMLLSEGRVNESIRFSVQAIELLPNDSRPLANVGAALTRAGRFQEALAPLNAALEIDPDRSSVLINRGNIHNQLGSPALAVADWETALTLTPADETVRAQLAGLSLALGDEHRAVKHYRELLKRRPESLDYLGVLAWILATSPDEELRDGEEAVQLAAQWVAGAKPNDPKPLNALAAALAAMGQFDEAVATIEHAIELAAGQENRAMIRVYGQRLELYQQEKPFLRNAQK